MKTAIAFAAVAFIAASAGASFAQEQITLGEPGYGGTGCPGGSVSTTLSPDATSLSLLFDSYTVEAGGDTGKKFDRKSCNVAIPVHVPQGMSVSVLAIDYRGYNNFGAGADSQFNVEYFFAGARGPTFTKTFKGPKDEDYLIHNELTAKTIVWSKCGADVNLRTNSSIRVNTKNNQQALATVDSEDVSAAIIYQLQWKKC
jgi:GTPase involved in cell partitioning and DNA repair